MKCDHRYSVKKQGTALFLALLLLQMPVKAAGAVYSDVSAGDWYGTGVAVCAEKGVMIGTSEDEFSPELELTNAQCLTLALRLYSLQRGGTGELEKAPDTWDYMTLTTDDGSIYHAGAGGDPNVWRWRWGYRWDGLCLLAENEEEKERFHEVCAWGVNLPATLELNGVHIRGNVCWADDVGQGDLFLIFVPEEYDLKDVLREASGTPTNQKWWRDAVYTARLWGLMDDRDGPLSYMAFWPDLPATRENFARAVALSAGGLKSRFSVPRLPDLARAGNEDIFSLYEAGILTGMGPYGTFVGEGELTRAEAAVIIARVLDEGQRLSDPPLETDSPDYALTEVDLQGWEFDYKAECSSAAWLPLVQYSGEGESYMFRGGLYRVDGTIVDLGNDCRVLGPIYLDTPKEDTFPYKQYIPIGQYKNNGNDCFYGLIELESGEIVLQPTTFEACARAYETAPVSAVGPGPFTPQYDGRYYDQTGEPVSPRFKWAGPLDAQGAGFVGLNNKIYYIQFCLDD